MTRRATRGSTRPRPTPASVFTTLGGVILSWMLGAVVVRLGLDWSDTFPYSPASEWRYLGVALLALAIAVGGSVLAWRFGRRFRRHPKPAADDRQ
ncbi:hypothetical protein CLV85_0881 [Salinibacterium amurskyense]|uniref:Uncharacterized protein n=1 Tax=Salinibacterium amurskyense TaxID=205941 RepID=A0A2M9D7Q2_9MICO|nr:hypothetical protein [Salinibacterium amurskyense]PJJ81702.1 hypothetical protein CLV85_0881 [Salinibacterium amurskyense]